jgi:nucleotide-binding universal stress UspA family protein
MLYQKILTLLEGSPGAEKILPYVEELVYKLGALVILLQVGELIVAVAEPYDVVPLYYAQEVRQKAEVAKQYLARVQTTFHQKGTSAVKTFVESGPVVKRILMISEREQVDLIAYASHGRSGLARSFYGSVAAGILQQTKYPLLLIHAQN